MNCEDHVGESISTNSSLSSSGLSREDFYAAFRIASDSALTEQTYTWHGKSALICVFAHRRLALSTHCDIGRKKK